MKRVTFPTGRANKRLVFEEERTTSDGRGGTTRTWETAFTVFGTLEPVKTYERWASEQVQRETTHKARIRYREGVHANLRFTYAGRIFDITGVIDLHEQRRVLEVHAKEVTQ